MKESDRIATVTASLAALGARVEALDDGMTDLRDRAPLRGGSIESFGDHRIAMAMAVAGLAAEGTTTIEGWDAVATSYPGFENDLERLCGS